MTSSLPSPAHYRLTILGCGSSGGVPRVAQGWGACDPNNPKNRRQRCSVLVERFAEKPAENAAPQTIPTTRILIDCSPDLRNQLLSANVRYLDALVLTHAHADHIHGIDDIRPLTLAMRRRLPLYADAPTLKAMREKFTYVFETPAGSSYPPLVDGHEIFAGEAFDIAGAGGAITFTPLLLEHGDIHALGFRVGNLAYTPDLNGIPDLTIPLLSGLDMWIVDALRPTPHPSHLSLPETLDWIDRVKPRQAILTNLHVDMDFETLVKQLPAKIMPAYDGLMIDWTF